VDEIVNTIKGLGEKVEELIIVQKVLRSLPLRFDVKVYSIEEMKDLDLLAMDELYGILKTYEMRIEKTKSIKERKILQSFKEEKEQRA
jgi:hypothetical protein